MTAKLLKSIKPFLVYGKEVFIRGDEIAIAGKTQVTEEESDKIMAYLAHEGIVKTGDFTVYLFTKRAK